MRTRVAIRNLTSARSLTVVVILAVTSTTTVAQDPRGTIPERLAQAGHDTGTVHGVGSGTVADPNSREYLRSFTDRLFRDTDVIVRGTVGEPRVSYLSGDQMEVYTDYPIENPVFLSKAKTSSTFARSPSFRPAANGAANGITRGSSTSQKLPA